MPLVCRFCSHEIDENTRVDSSTCPVNSLKNDNILHDYKSKEPTIDIRQPRGDTSYVFDDEREDYGY